MEDPAFQKVFDKMFNSRMQLIKQKEKEVDDGKVKSKDTTGNCNKRMLSPGVKSPSDTTLYTPALQKTADKGMVERISNFVESIRLEGDRSGKDRNVSRRQSPLASSSYMPSDVGAATQHGPEYDAAKIRTQHEVVEAEKFKASLLPVSGMVDDMLANNNGIGQDENLTDDQFFHLTCHVNAALREKIERGQFVDLEKLLPKDKIS